MSRRSITSALFTLSLILLLPSTHAQTGTCYWPDGTDAAITSPNTTYEVCTSTVAGSTHSMCCDTTAHNGGPSKCMPNGLCFYPNFATFFREGCTDPTWQDPACLKLYPNGTTVNPASEGRVWVNYCTSNLDAGPWCDHDNQTQCCAAKDGFMIESTGVVAYSVVLGSTSGMVATATATATASAAADVIATSTPSSTAPVSVSSTANSNNTTVIAVGIVAGILAGVLITAAVLFFLRRRKHQAGTKASDSVEDIPRPPPKNSEKAVYVKEYSQRSTVSEMPGSYGQQEMWGSVPRYELEQPCEELPHANYVYVKK